MEEKKNSNWVVRNAKRLWGMGFEALLGIILLLPSFVFLIHILDNGYYYTIRHICADYGSECLIAVTLLYGMLALAGAYLIKGNFKKKE